MLGIIQILVTIIKDRRVKTRSRELLIFYVPDSDPDKNCCMIETHNDKLFIKFVKDINQTLITCKKLAKEEAIGTIILCPHFTHDDFKEIREAVGSDVELYQINVKKIK